MASTIGHAQYVECLWGTLRTIITLESFDAFTGGKKAIEGSLARTKIIAHVDFSAIYVSESWITVAKTIQTATFMVAVLGTLNLITRFPFISFFTDAFPGGIIASSMFTFGTLEEGPPRTVVGGQMAPSWITFTDTVGTTPAVIGATTWASAGLASRADEGPLAFADPIDADAMVSARAISRALILEVVVTG